MRFKNEVKVGLLAIATLGLFMVGLSYLRGRSVLDRANTGYVHYTNSSGLHTGSMVSYKGFKVGQVQNVEYVQESGRIKVTFDFTKGIPIPANSYALVSVSIFGTASIEIVGGSGDQMLEDGGTLRDSIAPGLMAQLDPLKVKLQSVLENVDSITVVLNRTVRGQNTQLKRVMNNVEAATGSVSETLAVLKQSLHKAQAAMAAVQRTVDTLRNNQNLWAAIGNARVFTDSLAASSENIRATLASAQQTIQRVSNLMAKLDTTQGALGSLLLDPALAANLESSTASLNALLVDLKAHPSRYVHFSIFGRRER
jgi:phospholipid/cholesterol/gamma-HCH transport system substrate-binding protein